MSRSIPKVLALCLGLLAPAVGAAGEPRPLRVLVTTYPIHLLAQAVVAGADGVTLDLLLPAGLGCPHDYALTPGELRKLEAADVLVVNGLGLEEFLGTPAVRAAQRLRVIDASRGVTKVLRYADEDEGARGAHGPGDHGGAEASEHEHDHAHAGPNPHHFASPRAAAQVVRHLAEELSKLRPGAAARFRGNAAAAAARLDALADDLRRTVARLSNRRVVTEHGVFDYLADDAGLELVAVLSAHPGEEPSAAELLRLVRRVKASRVGAIFAEPQYPAQVARTVAREAGTPLGTLDPVASGPSGAGFDHYVQVMETNRRVLEETLRGR